MPIDPVRPSTIMRSAPGPHIGLDESRQFSGHLGPLTETSARSRLG